MTNAGGITRTYGFKPRQLHFFEHEGLARHRRATFISSIDCRDSLPRTETTWQMPLELHGLNPEVVGSNPTGSTFLNHVSETN